MRAAIQPLTPGWVAVSVRARHLLTRRFGLGGAARDLARSRSLPDALALLAGSAYGRSVQPDLDLAAAQRAVAETVLWHVRVLIGWAPPGAIEPLRALAGWFELANVEDRLSYIEGGPPPVPFELGGLATSPGVARAQSVAELRAALAGTPWGDPGADDAASIRLGLRFAWAHRVIGTAEEAADWAAGAVALLLARELLLAGRSPGALPAQRLPGVGSDWASAATVGALRTALPAEAAWALQGIEEPDDLWRAEAAWWRTVEQEAEHLARQAHLGRPAVIGAVALLGVDGRRTAAALEVAARGGDPAALEVFDEVA